MGIDFYYSCLSDRSRSVWMTLKALGISPTMHHLDLLKGEHKTDEYKKIHPGQQVPAINDDGFVIWESRAMTPYLVDKFGKDEHDKLYPKDLQKRSEVDLLLYFDAGTLGKNIVPFMLSLFAGNPDMSLMENIKNALSKFESRLGKCRYALGDDVTIADFSCWGTISLLEITKFDFKEYPNISKWFKNIKELPYFDECNDGFYAVAKEIESQRASQAAGAQEAATTEQTEE